METPKPPASSQIRRPSTRPYARRKRESPPAETADSSTETAQQLAAEVEAAVKEAPRPRARARAKASAAPAVAMAAAAPVIAEAAPRPGAAYAVAATAAVPLAPAALLGETEAPGAIVETASSSAETVPILVPISAVLSNSFAASSLAAVEAITSAAPAAALDPVTSIAQLSPREISETSAASLSVLAAALALTELPSPRHLPSGAPTDAAPPPGLVPRGDSRSLRRGELFALVYRVHCFVITRHGKVGQLGHWSAVEYPTPSAASHAYARGCSHWVSEGFLDYRGEAR